MTAGLDGGYFLVVTADADNVAELTTDKIYIVGPEVNIDQTSNKAWVIGGGAMKMESATNFQGDKLDKPVPLTVHWDKSMLFNGESAEFHGQHHRRAGEGAPRLPAPAGELRPAHLAQAGQQDRPARPRQPDALRQGRSASRSWSSPARA